MTEYETFSLLKGGRKEYNWVLFLAKCTFTLPFQLKVNTAKYSRKMIAYLLIFEMRKVSRNGKNR